MINTIIIFDKEKEHNFSASNIAAISFYYDNTVSGSYFFVLEPGNWDCE